jgi:hypothetical protein
MIQHVANWACVIGFGITIITLLTTLNIRGKIDRSLGKQRFLQQREKIVADFGAARQRAKYADGADVQARDALLLDLRTLALQLSHFHIWRLGDRLKLRRFIRFVSRAYMPDKPGAKASAKELVMRVDEVVAIVKAQAEV